MDHPSSNEIGGCRPLVLAWNVHCRRALASFEPPLAATFQVFLVGVWCSSHKDQDVCSSRPPGQPVRDHVQTHTKSHLSHLTTLIHELLDEDAHLRLCVLRTRPMPVLAMVNRLVRPVSWKCPLIRPRGVYGSPRVLAMVKRLTKLPSRSRLIPCVPRPSFPQPAVIPGRFGQTGGYAGRTPLVGAKVRRSRSTSGLWQAETTYSALWTERWYQCCAVGNTEQRVVIMHAWYQYNESADSPAQVGFVHRAERACPATIAAVQ